MSDKRYIISDASKMLDVESHVLRYWEEELEIKISRNEMGHRYYTADDIELLRRVRDLKRQGYGLRMIKIMLGRSEDELKFNCEKHKSELPWSRVDAGQRKNEVIQSEAELSRDNKLEQFQEIMNNIIVKALKKSGKELGEQIGRELGKEMCEEVANRLKKEVSDGVSTKVIKEMDYRLRMNEELEEERYRKLDEAIRSKQKHARKTKKTKDKEKQGKDFGKIELFRGRKGTQTT